MSNTYISNEVTKILKSEQYPESLALACAWIVAHFKGVNLKIYDATDTSSLCDYNLIASADNTIQAKSMIEEMISNFKNLDVNIVSLEGMDEAEWILLDLGDVIVHIFQDISRDVFDLDSLWADRPQLKIPQEYYFGEANATAAPKKTSNNYF